MKRMIPIVDLTSGAVSMRRYAAKFSVVPTQTVGCRPTATRLGRSRGRQLPGVSCAR